MTGPEHYREAEQLLAEDEVIREQGGDPGDMLIAAQVHATLALAAATAGQLADPYVGDGTHITDWFHATTSRACCDAATAPQDISVYRASHDSIVMGLYTTATEARAHCVAEERRSWAKGESTVFDWIEDEEDGVAELVTVDEDGETETVTGYVVTALTVASAYDEEADE